jgi:hypothetical protein
MNCFSYDKITAGAYLQIRRGLKGVFVFPENNALNNYIPRGRAVYGSAGVLFC